MWIGVGQYHDDMEAVVELRLCGRRVQTSEITILTVRFVPFEVSAPMG